MIHSQIEVCLISFSENLIDSSCNFSIKSRSLRWLNAGNATRITEMQVPTWRCGEKTKVSDYVSVSVHYWSKSRALWIGRKMKKIANCVGFMKVIRVKSRQFVRRSIKNKFLEKTWSRLGCGRYVFLCLCFVDCCYYLLTSINPSLFHFNSKFCRINIIPLARKLHRFLEFFWSRWNEVPKVASAYNLTK